MNNKSHTKVSNRLPTASCQCVPLYVYVLHLENMKFASKLQHPISSYFQSFSSFKWLIVVCLVASFRSLILIMISIDKYLDVKSFCSGAEPVQMSVAKFLSFIKKHDELSEFIVNSFLIFENFDQHLLFDVNAILSGTWTSEIQNSELLLNIGDRF